MSLTNEDLQAISQLLDEKLEEKLEEKLDEKLEEKLEEKLDKKLDVRFEKFGKELEEKFDAKLDARITPLENSLRRIEVDLLENNVIPRLDTIESCYLDTYKRYQECTDKMEETFLDVDVLKKVVEEHSRILQKMA